TGGELLDAPCQIQAAEPIATEVEGAEGGCIEFEIGACRAGPSLGAGRAALQLQLTGIPRTELVVDPEHEPAVGSVSPAGEGDSGVHQPHPEAVFDPRLRLPPVGQEKPQGFVHRPHLGRDPGHQIDVQHMAPERRVGLGCGRHQLLQPERPVRPSGVPVHLDPIDRKARWLVAGLMEHPILRARAFPVQLQVAELAADPALIEPEHSRLAVAGSLPDAGECRHRAGHVDQREPSAAGDRVGEGRPRPFDLDRRLVRGQAITEADVDGGLRGIEGGQWFAPLVDVIELAPHHRRVGTLLLRPDGPELETGWRRYRWTSARARQGLPDPLTSLSGATTSTAPVAGSFARLASWVRPYLFAPSRNWWQGNGGL